MTVFVSSRTVPPLAMSAYALALDRPFASITAVIAAATPVDARSDGERLRARVVQVAPGLTPGDVHIVSQSFNLYFVLPGDTAIRYGVAIGQEGLGWRGQALIGRKVEWPSWRPTDEMIARNPGRYARYADGMPGGPDNPLGPRALYFFQGDRDTAIRIHGTLEPGSIGARASNGCFRMYSGHVIDLYNRVQLGARAYAY